MRTTDAIVAEDYEKGSGTVQALGYFAVLFCLFLALVSAGAILQAKHYAQTSADLGAIAGAHALSEGQPQVEACRYASRIVRENKSVLVSCEIAGEAVTVMAESQPSLSALPRMSAHAVAAPEE